MDIQSKLKHMYDSASKQSFTHRFYKTGSFGGSAQALTQSPRGSNNFNDGASGEDNGME